MKPVPGQLRRTVKSPEDRPPRGTRRPVSPAAHGAVDLECAHALLERLPPVIWFLRREMQSRNRRGVSMPQFRTLAQLDRFGALSLSSVAENLGCSLPAASRLVETMVRRGLLRRTSCAEDRRQLRLLVTSSGLALLRESRRTTARVLAGQIAQLSSTRKQELLRVMESLEGIFEQELARVWRPD